VEEEYNPDHQLHHGQKFFRDGTAEEARTIMNQRFDRHLETVKDPVVKMKINIERDVAVEHSINDPAQWPEGWPVVDVHGKLEEY